MPLPPTDEEREAARREIKELQAELAQMDLNIGAYSDELREIKRRVRQRAITHPPRAKAHYRSEIAELLAGAGMREQLPRRGLASPLVVSNDRPAGFKPLREARTPGPPRPSRPDELTHDRLFGERTNLTGRPQPAIMPSVTVHGGWPNSSRTVAHAAKEKTRSREKGMRAPTARSPERVVAANDSVPSEDVTTA